MLRQRFFVAILVCLWACSDDTGGSSLTGGNGPAGSGGQDNKYYPTPNGEHTSESKACVTLRDALTMRSLTLGCVKTIRPCPELLTTVYQPACMEYDLGTVEACIQYFQGITDCAALVDTDCVLTGYPETAPAGCPAQ